MRKIAPIVANVRLLVALCASLLACDAARAQPIAGGSQATSAAQLRQILVDAGISMEAAYYFSAVQIVDVRSSERSYSYRETFPDAATRSVSFAFEPGRSYDLTAEERATTRADEVEVYRVRVAHKPLADGSMTTRVEFFVPYDAMPADVRERLRPAAAWNWPALLGIQSAVAQPAEPEGIDAIFQATLKEGGEQIAGLIENWRTGGPAASVYSAVGDIDDAAKLGRETDEYYKILDELEKCARNPTHDVPVPDDERQRQLDTLARIRSEVKEVTAVRFLNQMADQPLGAAGAVGAVLSVGLKPLATWNDQSLQSYIRNVLLEEARRSVVPCTPRCERPASARAATSAPPSGSAPRSGGQAPSSGGRPSAAPPAAASTAPVAPPPEDCDPNPDRVMVRLREIEQMDDHSGNGYFDRYATFSASAIMTRTAPDLSKGYGSGTFREDLRNVQYDTCERRITNIVQGAMTVTFQRDNGEVDVVVTSDPFRPTVDVLYERYPSASPCSGAYTGTQQGPRLALNCIFTDVDFERGGVYKDQTMENHTDDDEVRIDECEITIGGPPPPDDEEPPPPPPRSPRATLPTSSGSGGGAAAPPPPVAGLPAGGAPQGSPSATTQNQPQTARYRALLTGVRAVAPTRDGAGDADGRGDELYVAAASFSWDRLTGRVSGFQLKRTREYGDTGIANAPQRVRAGSAGPTGGIAAGDVAPAGFTADAAGGGRSDQLPLLVWEGALTAGVDALVIAPTLWERDTRSRMFDAYRLGWLTASVPAVMAQPTLAAELARPALAVTKAPDPSAEQAAALVTRGVAGQYVAAVSQSVAEGGEDRPIGIGLFTAAAAVYAERYVVVTREKLALPVGGATTLAVPLTDSEDSSLGGGYELYLRFERIQ